MGNQTIQSEAEQLFQEEEGPNEEDVEKINRIKRRYIPKEKKTYKFQLSQCVKADVNDFYSINDDEDNLGPNTPCTPPNPLKTPSSVFSSSPLTPKKNPRLNSISNQMSVEALLPSTPSWKSPDDSVRFLLMTPNSFRVEKTISPSDGEVKNILYFPKHRKLVVRTQNIKIFSTAGGSFKQTTNISLREGHVRDMIKWTEDDLLYGGNTTIVHCLRFEKSDEDIKITKSFRESDSAIIKLLRINDKLFAAMNSSGVINIFDFPSGNYFCRLVKTYSGADVPDHQVLFRSKLYPNCIYFNVKDKKKAIIKLVDWKEDKCLLEFTDLPTVTSVESILNKSGNEVILVTTRVHEAPVIMIQTNSGVTSILNIHKYTTFDGHPSSIFCYFNRYIFIGSSRGQVNLIDVRKSYLGLQVHKKRVNDIKFYYYFQKKKSGSTIIRDNDSLRFFTCSSDGTIKSIVLKLKERGFMGVGDEENDNEEKKGLLEDEKSEFTSESTDSDSDSDSGSDDESEGESESESESDD